MIFSSLSKFLGIHELPEVAQELAQKFVIIVIFIDLITYMSTTFFVLFVIDSVGVIQLGILLAVRYFVQAILDYPSGVLGDWLGHKWVLFTAFLTFAIGYTALAFANSFSSFLVVYLLFAIGASQQSGALMAWFENNYKIAIGDTDPKRNIYKYFLGKWRVITQFTSTIPFVIGGVVASFYFRELVFMIQAVGMFFLAFSFLLLIKNLPIDEKSDKKSIMSYFVLMKEGITIVFLNKVILFLILGVCLNSASIIIWIEMILYPLYFGYTGSDGLVSILRLATVIVGIPTAAIAAKFSSEMGIKKLPYIVLISNILFYGGFMFLTTWIPIERKIFNLIAIIVTIIIYVFSMFFIQILEIFEQRIFLDIIPDKNRNSVYSLIPTLIFLINIPSVSLGGVLIDNLGVPITLFLLNLIGIVAPVFYWLSIHFMPSDTHNHHLYSFKQS